jgi:micrococcal nuclease
MKKLSLLILGIMLSVSAFCQTTIKLEDIAKHVGDSVKVCGTVYGGIFLSRAKETPTFLNVGAAYPNNPLTLVIWADTRATFATAPETMYKDKAICVTGKVELYKDKPQIVIYNKEQVVINN